MARNNISLTLNLSYSDIYPLLMDQGISNHHVVCGVSTSSNEQNSFHPPSSPCSMPQRNIATAAESSNGPPMLEENQAQAQLGYSAVHSIGRSSSSSSRLQLIPRTSLLRTSSFVQQHRDDNRYSTSQRSSPLNSGLWISLEAFITVGQILAAIIVLGLSRNEKPKAPLNFWIIGYTVGCVAVLPLLYWRYRQRCMHLNHYQEDETPSVSIVSSSYTSNSSVLAQSASQHNGQVEDIESGLPVPGRQEVAVSRSSSIAKHVERFKMALDCFFAIWFVVGNVWIFGGHSSADGAPNLYRLCIVFLTFSCISYAMPLVICATVCCCLPCIVTLLSYREETRHVKGALPDVIAALPVYKFHRKGSSEGCKDETDSDSETCEGGIFAAGTERERIISGDDAVCCICLGRYKDGVDLKELQCTHFFHVECIEKWLKINATCPMCKLEVGIANVDEQSG
ncbi:hypothetical protein KP509_20G075100 [Ceratopteris richardii]|uniref:RING-type domain-containing protein n=1 Tax=Ceratopteris richardii TaxID=49495 RepID=A0A8T2SJK2_CERRI|nr:hypothetical protein KP509_20G075100 [Ceratopteris richardii]KAH7332201.1 hypothetical protein KP509_20G075100 [Ceratopteris richardii]KAH7332202.1 hypothetical protein KP509_20G075100 [Ceratopteris richardii]KAH7332203.1 hypothetical protein KP509_20G075100 [Ceratopteris richardii]KAH7332204.1 hypothetical protein KP509_20G075100 [Ceratopteris richardii]